MIRKRFVAEMARRFAALRRAITLFLVTDDTLGLSGESRHVTVNSPRQFASLTQADKLKAFNNWFKQQVDAKIFSVPPGTDPDRPWTAEFIESAYKQGIVNAFIASRNTLDESPIPDSQIQFLRTSFGAPEALAKARLLATQSFEHVKGITAEMGSSMNLILAKGMLEGQGVKQIAKEMTESVDGLTDKKALQVARTETIRAHAEGQLTAFEKLGVEELGLEAEFSTAGDSRVCLICFALEGKIFKVSEASGIIPQHVGCRCSWIPRVK